MKPQTPAMLYHLALDFEEDAECGTIEFDAVEFEYVIFPKESKYSFKISVEDETFETWTSNFAEGASDVANWYCVSVWNKNWRHALAR